MPSPDAPDKDLKPGIGLGSHRSPKNKITVNLIKSFFRKAVTVPVAAFLVLKDGLQDVTKKA
jgi:hypothetical protein